MHLQQLTSEAFSGGDYYCSITGLDLDYKQFILAFGEEKFSLLKEKLETSGMAFRGFMGDSAIFDLPSPLRDSLREEIEEILDEEIFVDD